MDEYGRTGNRLFPYLDSVEYALAKKSRFRRFTQILYSLFHTEDYRGHEQSGKKISMTSV